MELQKRSLDSLHPYENNPRDNDGAVEAVCESIRQCSYISPIIVDEDGVILAGHTRYKALQKLGYESAEVIVREGLTEEQKRKFRVLDNKVGEFAEWDMEKLEIELSDIDLGDFDFGFEFGDEEEAIVVQEDDYEEAVPEVCNHKRGDIFQLGEHRLMCGDASCAEDVQKLTGGGHPSLVFTDPPYGVAIGDKNKMLREHVGGESITENIEGDTLSPEELREMLTKAFTNVKAVCAEDASYYVTAPQGGGIGLMMMMMMKDAGLECRHNLIWRKNSPTFSMGRLDYEYQHEPIMYTWDKKHNFYGKGKFKTSIWDVDKPRKCDLHPTMKPLELIANALLNSSKEGDTVLDIFGGSGSTLVACEQLGRKCMTMEIDPKYVQVIIDRWETLTGEKAVKL